MSGQEPPKNRTVNKQALFLLKLAASLFLLGFVVWKTGLDSREGRRNLLLTLQGVEQGYFVLSLLCGIVLTAISSWKWQVLLRCKGIRIGLPRLISIYFIGRFFNLFLPTSVGGDVVRVWELGRHSGEKYEALASVFVERLSGMVTLAVISIVAVCIELHEYNLPILNASILFLSVLILAIFWVILDTRILSLLDRFVGSRFAMTEKLLFKLNLIHGAIREYKDQPVALVQVYAISCLFYFMAIVNVWVTARAFSPDVSFSSMLLVVPAIMLVMNLPVSIGGLGLMEAAYALLFPLFGYTPALALSTALLIRFKTLLYGGFGGILHLVRLRAGRTPDSESRPGSDTCP